MGIHSEHFSKNFLPGEKYVLKLVYVKLINNVDVSNSFMFDQSEFGYPVTRYEHPQFEPKVVYGVLLITNYRFIMHHSSGGIVFAFPISFIMKMNISTGKMKKKDHKAKLQAIISNTDYGIYGPSLVGSPEETNILKMHIDLITPNSFDIHVLGLKATELKQIERFFNNIQNPGEISGREFYYQHGIALKGIKIALPCFGPSSSNSNSGSGIKTPESESEPNGKPASSNVRNQNNNSNNNNHSVQGNCNADNILLQQQTRAKQNTYTSASSDIRNAPKLPPKPLFIPPQIGLPVAPKPSVVSTVIPTSDTDKMTGSTVSSEIDEYHETSENEDVEQRNKQDKLACDNTSRTSKPEIQIQNTQIGIGAFCEPTQTKHRRGSVGTLGGIPEQNFDDGESDNNNNNKRNSATLAMQKSLSIFCAGKKPVEERHAHTVGDINQIKLTEGYKIFDPVLEYTRLGVTFFPVSPSLILSTRRQSLRCTPTDTQPSSPVINQHYIKLVKTMDKITQSLLSQRQQMSLSSFNFSPLSSRVNTPSLSPSSRADPKSPAKKKELSLLELSAPPTYLSVYKNIAEYSLKVPTNWTKLIGEDYFLPPLPIAKSSSFALSYCNVNYDICSSYPGVLALPINDEEVIKKSSEFRSKGRFIAMAWRSVVTGASLCRSSQPNRGLNGKNSSDYAIVEKVRSMIGADSLKGSSSLTRVVIIDCRSRIAATANSIQGKGTESIKEYPNCTIMFLNIENIHAVRSAYVGMRDIFVNWRNKEHTRPYFPTQGIEYIADVLRKKRSVPPPSTGESESSVGSSTNLYSRSHCLVLPNGATKTSDNGNIKCNDDCTDTLDQIIESLDDFYALGSSINTTFLSDIEKTMYYSHVASVLKGALIVCEVMCSLQCPALVHCSDGWDRTSQVTALAMLLMDARYATIDGFAVLIESQFVSFGHRFGTRCRHTWCNATGDYTESQVSPIFIQFLDCVYQIINQFPDRFEFNAKFLLYLAYHTYSGRTGTFLYDSEMDRIAHLIPQLTLSIWDLVSACPIGLEPINDRNLLDGSNVRRDFVNENFDREKHVFRIRQAGLAFLPVSIKPFSIKVWWDYWLQ